MAEPLRIALLTHSVNPRGGVVHVLELGRALMQRGHAVTVVAPATAGQRLFRDTPCRVELARCPSPPADANLRWTVRSRIDAVRTHLRALRAGEAFDVFHAHDGIGANALADLAEAGDVPGYLRTVHHVDRFPDAQVQAWETRSIRGAARLLAVSAVWCERLARDHGRPVEQVPNGVDLSRFSPHAEPMDAERLHGLGLAGRPRVLAVGGIEARKNSHRLLQAFVRLRQWLPQAQLVIAGGQSLLPHDAEVAAFSAAAAAAGLGIGAGQPVVLTGPLPDAVLPALYRSADVLAMPSLLEGFGLAALEALACGTPAVVSRLAPFTEHFVQDVGERDVHWADPLDIESIALALRRGVAAGRRPVVPEVCRRFDWSRSAERHEALYRLPLPVPALE
ncbi:MSMEG_0565 family glycosyltransferase [Aquabacterium sp. J223]|uniref:MSMEG_0565 family glycosyltransferase n=1 Tax=Aquabacterium sp. J223 TaxID=2898431 RepID=UPI0021ADA072|nr:MSMEG_0565 family glycosyltransferase [Aquabacterium sp. J223]UUX97003.1 MSMEG_0565 family glycosyltransferase [Aquabacterium sp. J223]